MYIIKRIYDCSIAVQDHNTTHIDHHILHHDSDALYHVDDHYWKMTMTNVATYKRRRDASWLRGKTNRGGVKGRMIGSHSQILPTNSISPEILKQIFSNTGIPVTTCEIEQTLVTVITLRMQKSKIGLKLNKAGKDAQTICQLM